MIRRPPRSTLFPYTTALPISHRQHGPADLAGLHGGRPGPAGSRRRRLPAGGDRARRQQHLDARSEEHTSELQSRQYLVFRLLLEKKKISKSSISLALPL